MGKCECRINVMVNSLAGWIWEHTDTDYDFALALKHCGFTEDDVFQWFVDGMCSNSFEEERDITVAIYNAYGVPFKYVVVSVCCNEELGEFDLLEDAEKHVKDLERFDKEHGNPFNDKFMIIVARKDK